MTDSILLSPLLPWPLIWALGVALVLLVGLSFWRGSSGWWLRALAGVALLLALANPSLQRETRDPLSDIVLLVVDDSSSNRIADRPAQVEEAVRALSDRLGGLRNVELRTVHVPDGESNTGSRVMTALSDALANEPRDRVAGAILVTDGQVHDMELAPDLPAPLQVLLTGRSQDWDRRLIIKNAPPFAILGEEVRLTLRIEDQGEVPPEFRDQAQLTLSIDGGEPTVVTVPVGEDLELPVRLPHGGMNVLQFDVAAAPDELTDRNNSAVVQINGVRDRLRVLLVSGEPHAGERTWRNLLKSDASVDLVHFTILRPPEKQDGVPVSELSLIAFPTRELFIEKIEEFDLIIFDRYRLRGILPAAYLENVRNYVEQGGAVLVAGGPESASADSLYRSPLAASFPATPSGRVIQQPFRPEITEIGRRHPVTEGLEKFSPPGQDGEPGWGRWFRLMELLPRGGEVVMSGAEDKPLLILDRVGKGRVALLASDQAWLWGRGYEGGGPQLELLRRLAHWTMKEPELEEEALTATADGQSITVTRRSLKDDPRQVTITAPDGTSVVVPLQETEPGRFTATYAAPSIGLYRLADGEMETVVALGPSAPKEFEQTIATGDKLSPQVAETGGGIFPVEDGIPAIREVSEGRLAAGRGWLGITPRQAYVTTDVQVSALLPPWAFLLAAGLLAVAAWLREGRR
ncbi:hypothetical protein CDV50_07235 [Haematobacter massiliensis]|uniref:Membrane protein n=1 Tax=Haematobacter massiliensis TaxID=195105 RepID=A0A086YBV6_9RHOB|nr:membrane protein [Haematobacter massiliensis]KFI31756.1 membrane protein [Haematobacter massiliensis]OWJ72140.1 hypothetical protein CDV50_07235 [Haematobacter massiliensis]OWJ87711.1 hypothetical protein CDV51_03910 [Haematobacter massiliensis]QBJ24147.1 hypothetical protein HmaOT1_07675 [Haematobacter massiliensis]